MVTIYDTILWLRSQSTGKRFPIVMFTADTDMVTMGWVSLTSTESLEIVITQATPDELRRLPVCDEGYLQVESRINKALSRSDLRSSWMTSAEKAGPIPPGLSFQEFRKVYRPPKLFFRDIFNPNGIAEVISEIERSQFESEGGKLLVLS